VMVGFLSLRMRPLLRRRLTRTLAVIPAAFTVYYAGDRGSYQLLILSQVILSLQLPFAVIPLIHFTSDRKRMGPFANGPWLRTGAWLTAGLIVVLNLRLARDEMTQFASGNGTMEALRMVLLPVSASLLVLLLWVALEPVLPSWFHRFGRKPGSKLAPVAAQLPNPVYSSILVPLDQSSLDRAAIAHAAALARAHRARLYLLHVEEDVTSQVYGAMSSTAEVEAGAEYLRQIASTLEEEGIQVYPTVRYSNNPKAEIVKYAQETKPDLIVMGAHGHKGLKDIIFGTTINAVRHKLKIPLLIVRGPQ